jgi:hypothetical protein
MAAPSTGVCLDIFLGFNTIMDNKAKVFIF